MNNKEKVNIKSQKTIGIYIHIPFCDKICNYCDFTVFQGATSKQEIYINALKNEIKLRENKSFVVDSIFIGGGTPSIINAKYIFDILKKIKESFTVLEDIEITIETNPKTLDIEKLDTYERAGINRLSLGVQSFNDEILKDLGRNHNSIDALETISLIKKYKFSLNLDLIFGYEKQSLTMLNKDLDIVESIYPDHISYYSLIIEEGTKFGSLYNCGKLKYMYDEDERKMYHNIVERLNKIGIEQYEISNFAKKGKQSEHNKKYWKCKEYLSFGVGAHSYIDFKRFSNTKNFSKYLKLLEKGEFPIDFEEYLEINTRKFERIIMNMRLNEGISLENYNLEFGEDFYLKNKKIIDRYVFDGVVKIENKMLKFTDFGRDITDKFFLEFVE